MERIKTVTSGLAFRMISAIVLMLMAFSWMVCVIGYSQFTESLTSEYNDSAFRTAETAATLIDGDRMEEYLKNGGDSDDYRLSWSRLNTLCQKQNVTLIYVIAPDTSDYGRFYSVFNTVNENSGYTPWEVGYERETTNEEYRNLYRDIYENGLERGTVARTTDLNGRPPHITSLIPVKGTDGTVNAILCVERPMSELETGRKDYLRAVVVSMLLLTIFVSYIIAVYLRYQFVKPMDQIIDEAHRFARENQKTEELNLGNISRIREIRILGDSVEKMESDILLYTENLTKITAEKERIGTELTLATKIQANMLPNHFPAYPDRTEFDIYASMTPAKEVGGDFYDFFLIDEDHMGIVMADVSGKGVPAALFMMMAKSYVKNFAIVGGTPGEVLTRVNDTICNNNKNNMFVTIWFGILTISTGRIVAANAGHEYPVIRKAGGSFELLKDKHGLVIGGMQGVRYREYEFTVEKGGTLFLYTDGVPEATNAFNKMFETGRMLEALNTEPDAAPQRVLEHVDAAVKEFVGEASQFDDLTMLAIKLL